MSLSTIPTELPSGNQSNYSGHDGKQLDDTSSVLGFGLLTFLLLVLCALLTGLTLAICGLDITRLQVSCVTGDQRHRSRALVTLRIKRHMSWFLCSMIICSVACAESIPVIIGSLFNNDWLPIVISTIAIAFFAELLPQFIMPRYAIVWTYYCWPLIWVCMWATCVISWPLSYLLEAISGPQIDKGIFTAEQLGTLITFHERAEKHGGFLGPDASRIMRGALNIDNRTLLGECQSRSGRAKAPFADVERGEAVESDILVPWSSVRYIRINEEVNKEFVSRIKIWGYSRIPVLGDVEVREQQPADCCEGWNNDKVYGFLHLKNLIGLNLSDQNSGSKSLLVKDLPLYPLPIVRNDLPLYDLLNVFQLGMARMAVVIPRPAKDLLVPLSASILNQGSLPRHRAPLWSASTGLDSRNIIEMLSLDAHIDWTIDFLDAAQNNIEPAQRRKHGVIGIGCPKPIGIITYEDIIDALLQKTSLDEKDFYERNYIIPPTKKRKEGDTNSVSSNHSIVRTKKAVPLYVAKVHAAFERRSGVNDSTIRRRIISRPEDGKSGEDSNILRRHNMAGPDDGTNSICEQSGQGFDGANERDVTLGKVSVNDRSSYTENSQGGFHDTKTAVELIDTLGISSAKRVVESDCFPPAAAYPATVGLNMGVEFPVKIFHTLNNLSCGTVTNIPNLHRGISFSTLAFPNSWRTYALTEQDKNFQDYRSLDVLNLEVYSGRGFNATLDHFRKSPARAVSLLPQGSSSPFGIGDFPRSVDNQELFHTSILNHLTRAGACQDEVCTNKSQKPPSSIIRTEEIIIHSAQSREVQLRKDSFHDDGTLLLSQRNRNDRKSQSKGRRTSFWF